MRNLLLTCLLCACANLLCAQTLTVVDGRTDAPMAGVTLLSLNPSLSVVTNAAGQADLTPFQGVAIVQIRSLGYETLNVSFEALREEDFRIRMHPSKPQLEQVVISATRWRQASTNLSSKISTISPRQVALYNPQTAADLLGISGKVFVQKSQQAGGSPMIRGFAANRLIYTVDGVRMNNAIFRGGNIQNVINLDPFATQHTEVLFGPGSVIYGSDAIGGVMSFQTLTLQLALGEEMLVTGKAVTRYSSANNERTGHFDVNLGWKKWALVTSLSAWDFDHLRQGSHGPEDYIKDVHVERRDSTDVVVDQVDELLQIPSAYSQINFMQKVRFKPSESWDLHYGFHYSETSAYGRYDRHNRFREGLPRYGAWDYGPQQWMMNNLHISHEGLGALYDQMSIRMAHQFFAESRTERNLNSNTRNATSEEVIALSANADFTKSTGTRNTLYYGFEYVINDVDSEGSVFNLSNGARIEGPARYPTASWSSVGVYVNDEFRLSPKTTLQAGLRYNWFGIDANFFRNIDFYPLPFLEVELRNAALTGSVGGVYRPEENWILRANFSTAFRAPNVDDIGKVFDSEPGAVVVPNPDAEAEYAYNMDIGLARIFGETVKLDVTAYYTILQNALVRRDFQLSGQDTIDYFGMPSRVQAIQNAAEARVYGLQLGLEVKLPSDFSFSTDLNFQVGEEELDDGSTSPSRHAAPFFGVSRLRYTRERLTLEVNAMVQGERRCEDLALEERRKDEIYAKDGNGNNYAPSWYTLNIKAMMKISKVFGVSAGIENITDQRYRPYSSGLSGAGRNFVVSLTATF